MSYSPTANCASTRTRAPEAERPLEPVPAPPRPVPRRPSPPKSSQPASQGSCSQYSTRRGPVMRSSRVEDLAIERAHVVALEHHGHRHDHREVLHGPAIVVLHREHGAVPSRMSTTVVASLWSVLSAPAT
jgi:hypothetical protein